MHSMHPPWITFPTHYIPHSSHCSGGSRIFLRGLLTLKVGVLTYYFTNFLPETAWKWKNLDLEEGMHTWWPPGSAFPCEIFPMHPITTYITFPTHDNDTTHFKSTTYTLHLRFLVLIDLVIYQVTPVSKELMTMTLTSAGCNQVREYLCSFCFV